MKNNSLVTHLIETIDKVFFGFEERNELEMLLDSSEQDGDNEEEFDVVRSIN